MSEPPVAPEGIIRVMPESLANKIAAGEVVQRPASAVKELVENAIDAGADQITILIKAAGSELLQVIDNGCGMSPSDALLSLRRHATSKIQTIEDLERIETLGFRGEALASIAAVAQVELRTKRVEDEAGYQVRVEGARIAEHGPCATANGTSVTVRNLFYNVPARRNFLKTPATEFKHLVDTFQFLALSNPSIGFSLFNDDAEVYRLSPARNLSFHDALRKRIGAIFGGQAAESLVEVEETTSYLTIRGFVARPTFHRRSRGEQFYFVNGRFVRNRSLDHAVLSAYAESLPEGAFPFFVLFLSLDPRHIDVNVHPTKAEIKFDDERGVYGFIRAVVRRALGMADLTPQIADFRSGDATASPGIAPAAVASAFGGRSGATFSGGGSAETQSERSSTRGRPVTGGYAPPPSRSGDSNELPGELSARLYGPAPSTHAMVVPSAVQPGREEARAEDESQMWQLHDRYILSPIRSGLMVVDQNAAHERILFERALQSIRSGFGLSQQLLFPTTIEFGAGDFELIKELLPDLRSLGFDVELFSGRSVVVRGVPADIRTGDERSILEDILEQYKAYRDQYRLKTHENLARSMAQRSAIPSGRRLNIKEMRALIDQLFSCEMPYACPMGRPTMVKISLEELDKRFGRP